MSKAEDYRQLAAECVRTAKLMTDPEAKTSMLAMAREWHSVADQAERNNNPDNDNLKIK